MTISTLRLTHAVQVELRALSEIGAITSKQLKAVLAFVAKTDMAEYDNMRTTDCADLMLTLSRAK